MTTVCVRNGEEAGGRETDSPALFGLVLAGNTMPLFEYNSIIPRILRVSNVFVSSGRQSYKNYPHPTTTLYTSTLSTPAKMCTTITVICRMCGQKLNEWLDSCVEESCVRRNPEKKPSMSYSRREVDACPNCEIKERMKAAGGGSRRN